MPAHPPLRAVTVRQPWATCLVGTAGPDGWIPGPKRFETRSWCHPQFLGWHPNEGPRTSAWIAIHAGARDDDLPPAPGLEEDDRPNGRADIGGSGFARPRPGWERLRDLWPALPDPARWPRSAVLAIAEVDGVFHREDHLAVKADPWVRDVWAWRIARVVPLVTPIPYSGSLGLWELGPPTVAELRTAYRLAKGA